MAEQVTIYKYGVDWDGVLCLTALPAIKQKTRYKLLNSGREFSFRTFVSPDEVHLSIEEARQAAFERYTKELAALEMEMAAVKEYLVVLSQAKA